ncbi:hypothetical protein [Pedosphaera parvula]|uniref:Rax2-like C-terminal domain-containing protein n=1 Tax=Pedosphaera parvula (strain Ellin514) TaxID=320771 RepID=B9XT61_PEDPL|nr:hypothetical protein [Pedosphaera parvula]EEF56972.1 hypothetical protein Cflav_PD0007 [Pedosphaera parvula Ellin514]
MRPSIRAFFVTLLFMVTCMGHLSDLTAGSFTDADWTSLNGLPGANGKVSTVVINTNSGLVYIGGNFQFAGTTIVSNVAVWDGITWKSLGNGLKGTVSALALDDQGNLYVGGSFTTTGGIFATNIARWDGTSWSALGSGTSDSVLALAFDNSGTLYAGGSFTNIGGILASNIAAWDGAHWSAVGAGLTNRVAALSADASGLFASSTRGSLLPAVAQLSFWNGQAWSQLPMQAGTNKIQTVTGISADGSGDLFIGASLYPSGSGAVLKWSGGNWTILPGPIYGQVNAFGFDNSGNLFVGGLFSNIGGDPYLHGGVSAMNVAKWDGNNWSAPGGGIGQSGSPVLAVALDGWGNLYAGGTLTAGYFSQEDGIAKWDGTNWTTIQNVTLGPALTVAQDTINPPACYASAVDSKGNLFVGGDFGAWKWDGTNWTLLGRVSLLNSSIPQVNALVVDSDDNVYIGGYFEAVGSVSVTNLAKWDGTNWSAFGSQAPITAMTMDSAGNLYVANQGYSRVMQWVRQYNHWNDLGLLNIAFAGSINALLVDASNNLYVAGTSMESFNYDSGNYDTFNYVAKWVPSKFEWEALGSGPSNPVASLAIDAFGNLYAGGYPGMVEKWDGVTWKSFGPSFPITIDALRFDAFGNLYAGASWSAQQSLLKWDGAQWTTNFFGSGVNGSVNTFAIDGSRLYVGGNFTTAGTNYSAYIARANLPDSLVGLTPANHDSGTISWSLPGPSGRTCYLQTSTDLVNWTNFSTNICGPNGLWNFTVPATLTRQYFRAALQ